MPVPEEGRAAVFWWALRRFWAAAQWMDRPAFVLGRRVSLRRPDRAISVGRDRKRLCSGLGGISAYRTIPAASERAEMTENIFRRREGGRRTENEKIEKGLDKSGQTEYYNLQGRAVWSESTTLAGYPKNSDGGARRSKSREQRAGMRR